jgi:hypothetical protein
MQFSFYVNLPPLTISQSREAISVSAPPGRQVASVLYSSFVFLTVLIFLLLATFSVHAATPNNQDAKVASPYRACGVSTPESTVPLRSKRKKDNRPQQGTEIAPYCLEVHASTMDVQEHLQSFIRKQHWAISDEDVNESLWSFNLALTKDELLSYGKPEPAAEHINWQRGKTVVLVRSIDLGDGYTRSTVSAQLTGFGEPEDSFAMQRSSWTWYSNGKLESTLIGELRAHFHPDN